jgi:hypothetical protein
MLEGPSMPTETYRQHFPQGGQTSAGSVRAGRVGSSGGLGIGGGSFHGKEEK